MKRQSFVTWCQQAIVVMAALCWVRGLPAQELRVHAVSMPSNSAEARILAALDRPTQIDFVDTPLTDAIQYLKDLHHIEIQLDMKALEEVGIAADMPMTRNLTGVSLRSALDLILRGHDLVWTIQDEVLLITTPKVASPWLTTKVYNLSDIVGRESAGGQALVEIVTRTISPTTWKSAGGAGVITAIHCDGLHVLIIAQTDEVHRRVEQLLKILLAQRTPSAAKR